jgi:type I restriction enzyme S subunit
MRYDDFKNLIVFEPPLQEQTAIANFLDKKTAEIKEFIALKEKTIELLKERKMAIINHAVTKGLDPTVEMKDSGIEWLGEIPKHWEVKKFKYLLKEINERSKYGKEVLLSLSKYSGVLPKTSLDERSGGAESLIGYKVVSIDDIVVNKMQAVNGILNVSQLNGITSPDYSIYRLANELNSPVYFSFLMKHPLMVNQYNKVAKGVMDGYIRLYTGDLYNLEAIIPPYEEQQKIIKSINENAKSIDEVINNTLKEIELIKEYQQSLISEVVTGKVDVREYN